MAPPPLPLLNPRTPVPSRTSPSSAKLHDFLLRVRQAPASTVTVVTTTSSGSSGLSGGAIAGIVIGSVVGFLLLLWIIRSCFNLGAPPDREAWYDDPPPRRRRHHRREDSRYYYSERGRTRPPYGVYTQSTPVAEPVPVVVRGSSRRRPSTSKARSPRRSSSVMVERY
ncbi:hypothetical protein SCUCBS95973_008716 [Sporothrix curviconia]|uniref:Uncharacterized protein n=1 Tax=Sporothrix curviconia TaxID=1260050 RepID=A0ABP0CPP5_9PEZI